MHIPKTSGSALAKAFREALMPRRAAFGLDRVLFGSFKAFGTIAPDLRRQIYLDPADLPTEAEFVSGHISFSTLQMGYPNAQYITFLREPFSRMLSFWLYWRSLSDDELRPWGEWREFVHKARRPLIDFLSDKEIACPTDNLYVRMLLWPNNLLPDNDFIDKRHDKAIIRLATGRLKQFSYVDVIENPSFQANLRAWLGRPFVYSSENETKPIPRLLSLRLHAELTPATLDLLRARTRLDLRLWTTLARQWVSQVGAETLREFILLRNVARYSSILQGG
jgi:hypothetical protein